MSCCIRIISQKYFLQALQQTMQDCGMRSRSMTALNKNEKLSEPGNLL